MSLSQWLAVDEAEEEDVEEEEDAAEADREDELFVALAFFQCVQDFIFFLFFFHLEILIHFSFVH